MKFLDLVACYVFDNFDNTIEHLYTIHNRFTIQQQCPYNCKL